MFKTFLKHFGIGVAVAAVGAVAAYFAVPEHYAALGAFAGIAAYLGALAKDVLAKLIEKLNS